MKSFISYILQNRLFLWMLFIVNLFGTIYGYIWYESQLIDTAPIFLIFVPDSPTASLFFTIFLGFYLFGRHVPYIEALALVTLVKYGIWAVVMNLLLLIDYGGSLPWTGYMLIISHGAMAIQAVLYAPFYAIKVRHIVFAAIWTLHNDVIDYVFEQMPVYPSIMEHMNEIGYFTFWLSIGCIALAYVTTQKVRSN
ncbi:DUF1405 domain-containing protein [Halobacillus locisalis]|uniref:DUF1405 domain-containing protein n=1 Tax=Halobacillus locisalis TaxID=220753 RepID=A0A838CPG4_9BACI|nr:DUF1405 domain-containing protein [Halobacillus locisalis]MBA2173890.1 DUF1405 domain-containing protein [Halobacillus locisalis]